MRNSVLDHIHSNNGSAFTATRVREWLGRVGVKKLFIEPGFPWENGYIESFNGKLRNELMACDVFDTLLEATGLIERCRKACDTLPSYRCWDTGPRSRGPVGSLRLRLTKRMEAIPWQV